MNIFTKMHSRNITIIIVLCQLCHYTFIGLTTTCYQYCNKMCPYVPKQTIKYYYYDVVDYYYVILLLFSSRYKYMCVFSNFRLYRTFRWKFNNSGETLDMNSDRFSINGTNSVLKYTPITDQVSDGFCSCPSIEKYNKIVLNIGLRNIILLGKQRSGCSGTGVRISSCPRNITICRH